MKISRTATIISLPKPYQPWLQLLCLYLSISDRVASMKRVQRSRCATAKICTFVLFLCSCSTTMTYQGGNHLQIEVKSEKDKAVFVVEDIAIRSNFIDLSKKLLLKGQIMLYVGSNNTPNFLKSNYLLIRRLGNLIVIDLHDPQKGRSKFFENWQAWLLSALKYNQIQHLLITDKKNFHELVPHPEANSGH